MTDAHLRASNRDDGKGARQTPTQYAAAKKNPNSKQIFKILKIKLLQNP